MWLAHTFTVNAQFFASTVALKEGYKCVTYKELDQRTNALYEFFKTAGLKQGERVAVLSKNSIEVIETFVCCYKSGLIFVPLNYRLPPDKLNYILSDCGASALVVSKEYVGLISSGSLNTNNLKTIVVTTKPLPGMQFYDELVSEYSLETFDVNIRDTDPAAIIYSSGTTGLPKGVILSHRALLEVSKNFILELGIEPTDRTLNIMPLFHTGGHAWALTHLCRGATGVVMPEFNAKEVLEVMACELITTVHFVPTMIAMLIEEQDIASYDFSFLKTILYAGSSISVPLLKKAMGLFGPGKLVQCYGQTEHGPTISCLSRHEHIRAVQNEKAMELLKLVDVKLIANGIEHQLVIRENETLLDVLRDRLGLTGSKKGCDVGDCGTCTVIIDGESAMSCILLAVEMEGKSITTIEGLAHGGELHPIQQAFHEQGAVQCGFCTPGMIMSAKVMLDKNPDPSEYEVRRGISGNSCRCTGYDKPVKAIMSAAKSMQHREKSCVRG